MDKKIVVLPSDKMDTNKKEDRNEHKLIRMAKAVRDDLDPNNSGLEIVGVDKSKVLNSFKAFSSDIKTAKKLVECEDIEATDLNRVCFVSTKTFKKLGGSGPFIEMSITDTFSKILIGTDPELLIMRDGNVISAAGIPGFSKTSKFGSDGAMAELRPDPAYTAEGLTSNIKDLLNNQILTDAVKDYDWKSACYHESNARDYPVGTHIHIDNPKKIAGLTSEARSRLFAVTNKIMDELLTIPMIRLDGNMGHRRRAKCKMSTHNGYNNNTYGKGYGFFGEWRVCAGRLEHRSLSGLVLLDPDICTAVFGTAKAIAEAVYKAAIEQKLDRGFILPEEYSKTSIYHSEFSNWGNIPLAELLECTTSSGKMALIMNKSSRTDISIKFIKRWLTHIRRLSTYNDYSDNIESLGEILSCSGKTLDGFNTNMKNIWKD